MFSTHDFTNHYWAGKEAKHLIPMLLFVENLHVQRVPLYFSCYVLFNDFNCIVEEVCIDWVRKIRLRRSLRINSPGSSLIYLGSSCYSGDANRKLVQNLTESLEQQQSYQMNHLYAYLLTAVPIFSIGRAIFLFISNYCSPRRFNIECGHWL